jgi:molybdopterin-guanine dinucleotide biosynthesis protein B
MSIILGVYGYSSSGKTVLVEKLARKLSARYKVAVVKHIHEKKFTIDTRGKDTYRYAKAGAFLAVGASGEETAFILKNGKSLDEIVRLLGSCEPDIILVEGFRNAGIPKVAVGEAKETAGTLFRYRADKDFGKIVEYIESRIKMERGGVMKPEKISLKVNGKEIPMNEFVRDVLSKTLLGMVSSLRETEDMKEVEIKIRL